MRADPRFLRLPRDFWATVRLVSQEVGYTTRGHGTILVPTGAQIVEALAALSLNADHLFPAPGQTTPAGQLLLDYFAYRAGVLNTFVEPRLMDAKRAAKVFNDLKRRLRPRCPLPMNKQKGAKKAPAYLTGIVNILLEAGTGRHGCEYDPRTLTTVTRDGRPLRTLARRVDGAFPTATDPVAVWEIKEYYYTTTFGSRVADGVYESLLDGMELAELRDSEGVHVEHVLMVDAHYTWWDCGRSYLCRIVDMLQMQLIDEALFGYEVVERLPAMVAEWVNLLEARGRR